MEDLEKLIIVDFIKVEDQESDQYLVTGIVLEPDTIDSQGDMVNAEEIKKAAHDFMIQSRQMGNSHMTKAEDVYVAESYIAPMDLIIENQSVKKGSWVMTAKVNNKQLWSKIKKGEMTGFSIGARGIRTPM